MLAGDARALALLERLSPMAAVPPPPIPVRWRRCRSCARCSSRRRGSPESARRDVERAHGITLAAGLLVTAVALGTILFILEERRRRRRFAQKLEREANHDPLTMLPNAASSSSAGYTLAQARRDGNEIALLYIDLDGFKAVKIGTASPR